MSKIDQVSHAAMSVCGIPSGDGITPALKAVQGIELRVLYNAFAPDEVELHSLDFDPKRTLGEYLTGLPTEAEWMVFVNGEEVDPIAQADRTFERGDRLGLLLIPQGGNGGLKSVMRVVLQAAAIAALFIPGISVVAAAAISLGVGLVNAFLLTPKPPKSNSGDDSPSYGVDGAKNSATEDIPYPVVYGEFRVGGNFSDVYTENVGDNQYLYLRTILNDGEIEDVTDIELNEQPLSNYTDVATRIDKGGMDSGVNDWFNRSVVQVNKGGVAITPEWVTHITTDEVDAIRFDVMFSSGLVSISEKNGTYNSKSVTFETRVRKLDSITKEPVEDWVPLSQIGEILNMMVPRNTKERVNGKFTKEVWVFVTSTVPANHPSVLPDAPAEDAPAIEYRLVGSEGEWSRLGVMEIDQEQVAGYVSGSSTNDSEVTPWLTSVVQGSLPPGEYELRGVNGSEITRLQVYPKASSERFTVTDNRTRQIRKSFESERLERGIYEVAIRRINAQSTGSYELDAVVLTDVAEIDCEPVALRGTASLSMRIKLNEQLNGIPSVSCVVKGSLVQEYDSSGMPLVRRFSRNPAWHCIDALCDPQRGVGVRTDRIDWPRVIEFAQYCDDNEVYFNGVLDTKSNIGDVVQQIARVGHAAMIPFGKKYSFAVDKPRDPVTMFTQASALKGTFQVSYLPMQDRANDFEVTYYDKFDRNKAKTIRYVDQRAVTFNEMPRKASVSLLGVDNLKQAQAEMWRSIYSNRLLIRTVTFEAFMEAINCELGDVALIQHDQMQWAKSGRLKSGGTVNRVNLDQHIDSVVGPHRILVHYSALVRRTATVQERTGRRLTFVSSDIPANVGRITRARLAGNDLVDYEVVAIHRNGSAAVVELSAQGSGITSGSVVELCDTDVVVEHDVVGFGNTSDGNSFVTVTPNLPAPPAEYANYVFGRVEQVRKPYTLTGKSGSGIEKRRLTFMEYDERIYNAAEVDIPVPVGVPSARSINHVRNLLFDYDGVITADRMFIPVRAHWAIGQNVNYAGADVYMSLNGTDFRFMGTVTGGAEFYTNLSQNDHVEFKVVAFNTAGDRAPYVTAPSVSGRLLADVATLDEPTALHIIPLSFAVDAKVSVGFTPPADMTGVRGYEIQYRPAGGSWVSGASVSEGPAVITGMEEGSYEVRVRSMGFATTSVWVSERVVINAPVGSLMANWQHLNDLNADNILAPTMAENNAIEHTVNTDGTVNISAEWEWAGMEADIDGFMIEVSTQP